MRSLLLLFFPFWLAASTLYLLPMEREAALSSLLGAIDSATEKIEVAMFSFTHRELARALERAARRGVEVTLIYDPSNLESEHSQIGNLAKFRGIRTRILQGERDKRDRYNGKMHMKCALIDRSILFSGSANWSFSAFNLNYETLHLIDDPEALKHFQSYFEQMLALSEPF